VPRPSALADNKFLISISDTARHSLPYLLPVGEGIHIVREEPRPGVAMARRGGGRGPRGFTQDVLAMIRNARWNDALKLTSRVIERDPKDHEMYVHRAFVLYQLGQYADAVGDVTKSLDIKKTEKAKKLRAALWCLLGDREMAELDLDQTDDHSFKAARQKAVKAPLGPQLRAGARGAK
jgi:tetratricopeptide (TPR) repeat protein